MGLAPIWLSRLPGNGLRANCTDLIIITQCGTTIFVPLIGPPVRYYAITNFMNACQLSADARLDTISCLVNLVREKERIDSQYFPIAIPTGLRPAFKIFDNLRRRNTDKFFGSCEGFWCDSGSLQGSIKFLCGRHPISSGQPHFD